MLPAASATRPAALRLITGGWTTYYLGQRVDMLKQIHRGDPRLFAPVGPYRILRRPLPPAVADAVAYAELAATLAFTAGVRHRAVGPVHAALLLWTLS